MTEDEQTLIFEEILVAESRVKLMPQSNYMQVPYTEETSRILKEFRKSLDKPTK